MNRTTSLCWLILISILGCGGTNGELSIQLREPARLTVEQFEPFRLMFDVKHVSGNPFDFARTRVRLEIVTPQGKTLQHPAFFTRQYKIAVEYGREVARDTGEEHWEVRWTPTDTGTYQWRLIAEDNDRVHSVSGTLDSIPSNRSGFVRMSARDSSYFETSDGTFFYPIGHVTRSPFDRRQQSSIDDIEPLHLDWETLNKNNDTQPGALKTAMYERWFRSMHEAGENWCAIWMAPWWLELEWSPTRPGYRGLGHYNQLHAAQLDRILELAEKYQIRVLLYTANHGRLSTVIDAEWESNPHRVRADGTEISVSEFFRLESCRLHEENRLRYILARWGYSTALFGLCVCTEANWIDVYHGVTAQPNSLHVDGVAQKTTRIGYEKSLVDNWFRNMAAFVKQNDVHGHLVSMQFAMLDEGKQVWPLPEFDLILNNLYEDHLKSPSLKDQLQHPIEGIADGTLAWSRLMDVAEKPRLIAEWGGSHKFNASAVVEGQLHTGIWAISMSELAGITGFWWANEIDRKDLYKHFTAVKRFWGDYDRREKQLVSMEMPVLLEVASPEKGESRSRQMVSHPSRSSIFLANESDAFGYIYHRHSNSGDVPAIESRKLFFSQETEAWVSLPASLQPGDYIVRFYDTFTGEELGIAATPLTLSEDRKSYQLRLPPFRVDLAIQVRAKGLTEQGN